MKNDLFPIVYKARIKRISENLLKLKYRTKIEELQAGAIYIQSGHLITNDDFQSLNLPSQMVETEIKDWNQT